MKSIDIKSNLCGIGIYSIWQTDLFEVQNPGKKFCFMRHLGKRRLKD